MVSVVFLNLAIALAYFGFGRLGLLMALPPGYATAIWPPAGIAFAAFLIWGRLRAWPGVFLGSLAVNAWFSGSFVFGWLPVVIALASTVQADLGSRLLRYFDPRLELDRPLNVARFTLAGMLACVIASLSANLALLYAGKIGAAQFFANFLTWWMGDALGVMIFTPLMLVFFDRREVWRGRRFSVALPLLIAFGICTLVYSYVKVKEERQLADQFRDESVWLLKDIRDIELTHVRALTGLAALYEASREVEPSELAAFSARAIPQGGGFSSWAWAPLSVDSAGMPHARVASIQPYAGNEAMRKFDLFSVPQWENAIARATRTGQPALSKRFAFDEKGRLSSDFLLILPVRAPDQSLRGYCFATLNLAWWTAKLGEEKGLLWSVRTDDAQGGAVFGGNVQTQFPAFSGSSFSDAHGVYYQESIRVADRDWVFVLHKPFSVLVTELFPPTLLILLLALSVCGILGNIALIISGDRKRIGDEVELKTRELTAEIERRKKSERFLRENEQRFRMLFDEAPVGHVITRLRDGQFLNVNAVFSDTVGYAEEELRAMSERDLTPAEYGDEDQQQLEMLRQQGRYGPYEKHYLRKNGERIAVRLNGALVKAPGEETLVLSVIEDISDRERAESRAKLLAKVFEHSGDGLMITDHHNRIIEVNSAFTRQTGYSRDDVLGHNPRLLASGRTTVEEYDALWNGVADAGFWQGEIWDRHKDGHVYPKWLSISVVRDKQGDISHSIGSYTDVTERKAAEERIHYLAHHDPLTRLPNRFNLQGHLEQALATARRERSMLAVMFIDMDRFKTINDTLGHHVGDDLLIEVARRLERSLRDNDVVARLGGDEFVVVLPQVDTGSINVVAEKIMRSLGKVYEIDGRELHSTPSIGISLFPTDGDNVEALMRNADTAMYHAKSAGRNNFQFFSASMNADANERMRIEAGLRRALEQNQLVLHYQPQVDMASGRVVAVEALVRWQHPVEGLIPPLKFIAIAEETGLIIPIGEWVLDEALRQLAVWRTQGISGLRMAVNLSAHQLRTDRIVSLSAECLARHHLTRGDLELEITESVAMQHPRRTAGLLSELRASGVDLAIDDFGTGYSSLAYLKQLPLDRLKLDRSFVMDIEHDANDAAISAATISLAHSLGLAVVAEGVETLAQLDFLRGLGCDIAQGYYFSKPLPADACLECLKKMRVQGAGLG